MNNDLISRSALLSTIRPDDDADAECAVFMLHVKKLFRNAITNAPAADAMVIPCKIGDTVWAIRPTRGGHLCAMKGVVSEMQFVGSEMSLSITIRGRCRGEWGKTVFATREEAEAEIARKRGR